MPRSSIARVPPVPGPKALLDPELPISRGLLASWGFNEGGGTTVYDLSGNGHTGTWAGTTQWGAGKIGTGAVFNGASAVTFPDSAALHVQQMSVSAWVRGTAGSSFQGVAQVFSFNPNYAGYLLNISNTNTTAFLVSKNTGSTQGTDFQDAVSSGAVLDGTWHFIVGTYDGVTIRVYVDGLLAGSTAFAITLGYAATTYPRVGSENFSGSNTSFLTATVDEVNIWGRPLTAAEIQQLFLLQGTLYLPQRRFWTNKPGALYTQTVTATQGTTATVRKTATKVLSASQGSTATVTKTPTKSLSATQGSTAALTRAISKQVAATQGTTVVLAKAISKILQPAAQGTFASATATKNGNLPSNPQVTVSVQAVHRATIRVTGSATATASVKPVQ